MEDVSYLGNARVELTKNRMFPNLGRQMAEYSAAANFYTSEFYLDTPTFRNLCNSFTNTEMRNIMETWVFLREAPFPVNPETGWLQQALKDLDYNVGMNAIGYHVTEVQKNYQEYERVIAYIDAVREDVLENIGQFVEDEEDAEEGLAGLLPMLAKKPAEDVTLKYKVNLIVDHSETKGAPVVVTFNPTYTNLVGELEYDSEFGNLTTDFMKIKAGLFHQANGGYLIVQAQDILSTPQAWEALRRVMKTKEISMDSMRDQLLNVCPIQHKLVCIF